MKVSDLEILFEQEVKKPVQNEDGTYTTEYLAWINAKAVKWNNTLNNVIKSIDEIPDKDELHPLESIYCPSCNDDLENDDANLVSIILKDPLGDTEVECGACEQKVSIRLSTITSIVK